MDPSDSSKPRRGIRKLMDKLSVSGLRSRSRSPSQSSQGDSKALAPATGLGKNTRSTSDVSLDNPSPGAPPAGGRLTAPSTGSVPIVVEPIAEDVIATRLETEHDRSLETNPSRTMTSSFDTSGTEKPTGNIVWTTLRASLHFLQDSSSVFPALSSAVGVLVSCIDGLETAAKHRAEYGMLAETLSTMSNSLRQCMGSLLISDSLSSLAVSLEQEAVEIQERLGQIELRGFRDASASEEELLRHCRRIQSLFQQLQTNASLNTWSIANEQLANSRLEGLNPVKQAIYDSNLSSQVSRRGCTEGTRTAVLAGLNDWLDDPSSASIYWMNGMAGTGKTTIAYTFCEQLEKRKQLVASFFCTRNAVDCRDTSKILPTIAYQLARHSIPYQSALCSILGQSPDIGSKHVQKQFEQLLREPLQQVKDAIPERLVVVIDALDECDDRNGIERTLDMLFRYAQQVPLKFLVTSRPEPEIYQKMQSHQHSRIVIHLHNIETSLVQADVELYLSEELAPVSPSRTEVEQLAHRSGNLFIYAATLVRYIIYGKRVANPRQRLQSVLSLTPQSTKVHAEIDALYTAILESALEEAGIEDYETEDIKAVLRTVLFSQEPIDIDTIAALGGLEDSDQVLYALQPLRSVIYQSEQTGLVSTLHASFPDFLLSHQRSGAFFCDVVQYNQLLAQRCFSVMNSRLRFNICALESSFVPDEEVHDLETRIKVNIGPTLAYVCQYWANHLGMATRTGVLSRMLIEFLSCRLLFWMEVLNLTKMIDTGIYILQKANVWINQIGSPVSNNSFIKLVEDSYTFVTNFAGSPSSRSTPHIYISCLAFCPRSSQVYKHYQKNTHGLLELKGSLIDRRNSAAMVFWRDDKFKAAAFSSDGSRCLGALGDSVVVRNIHNGATLVGPIVGHTDAICACSFSSDGSRFISASKDGAIRMWDSYNGAPVGGPLKYDTSRIGTLKAGTGGTLKVLPSPFNYDTHFIKSILWSLDGTRIVACFQEASTIHLWDAITGIPVAVLGDHTHFVSAIAVSPDGIIFASASMDATVRLWSMKDGTPIACLHKGRARSIVTCVTFTPDGTRVISSTHSRIHIWRTSDKSIVASSRELKKEICSLEVSPDGTLIASGSIYATIDLWKVDDGTQLAGPFYASIDIPISFVSRYITSLRYTPDGTRLLAYASNGTVSVWPVQEMLSNSSLLEKYPISGVNSIMFTADGNHVLTRGTYISPYTVKNWDIRDGSLNEALVGDYYFPDTHTRSLISSNGRYAVVLTDGGKMRQVINPSDESIIMGPWPVTTDRIASEFSQDGETVAIASPDGTINLWDLQGREVIAGPFSCHNQEASYVAISPDSSLIASYQRNDILQVFSIRSPVLDITTTPSSLSDSNSTNVYDGWNIRDDGWIVNSSSHLLFCIPAEFKNSESWPSPHTSLIVTCDGTVQVPKQTLFLGELWNRCYISDNE